MRRLLRRLKNWWAFRRELAGNRRCAAGEHDWQGRQSTREELMWTPMFTYGSCRNCGAPLRKLRFA